MGQPVKIVSIKPDERPHRIVVLLDTSGSMLGDVYASGSKWALTQYIAADIARSNLENTSLALLMFSDKIEQRIGFSGGAAAISKRMAEIKADHTYERKHVRGTTALRDAVIAAVELLKEPGFKDSIYAITDAGDNKSRSRLRDVRNELASRGIRLFFTLVASAGPETHLPENEAGPLDATNLAGDTGGFLLGPVGANRFGTANYNLERSSLLGLKAGLDGLYLAMSRSDVVEVELPVPLKRWSRWTLEFSATERAAHKDLLVVYPRALAPCSEPKSPG
jgi:hypothetical protein